MITNILKHFRKNTLDENLQELNANSELLQKHGELFNTLKFNDEFVINMKPTVVIDKIEYSVLKFKDILSDDFYGIKISEEIDLSEELLQKIDGQVQKYNIN